MDILDAIQEFEDNINHPSMKPTISTEAKCTALKCMYHQLYNPIVTGDSAKQIYKESKEEQSEQSNLDAEKIIKYFKEMEK